MYGLDPRALVAALIVGTALAIALRGFAPADSRIGRSSRWLMPLAAVVPPFAVILATWRLRGWELEAILRIGGLFYGPALVTIALFLLGLSRPFARRRGAFARVAQRPLFWILAPYAVAGGILGGIALLHASDALAAAGNATVTHTLTAQFNAGTVPAGITTASDQLALTASTTPAAVFASSTNTTATVGVGGRTIGGGNPKVFLTLLGNATATTNYYDASVGTFSAGPALPTGTVNTGSFVIQRSATTYLLIRGGASTGLSIIDTQGVAVGSGSCTVAFGTGCWTITNSALALTATAGAGAHAIKRTDGRILIVHGNGVKTTTLYTPPGVGTEAVIAGPATTVNVGDGALSIPRTADTNWFTLVGGNVTAANRYAETGGTIVGGVDIGTFSATGVTVATAKITTGAFAIQYTDGVAGGVRWLVVTATTTSAFKYDPAGALSQAYTAVTLTGYTPGAGGHAFKRGDGTWILIAAGATTHLIWNPVTATSAATAAGFTSGNPGAGSHTFQRADGQLVIVRGGVSNVTDLYNGGWTMTATYQSEQIDPGFVDKWDQLSWTTATANGTTVTTGFRSAATCAANTGAFTAFAANVTGSTAITSATGNRCIQAEAILGRPVPQQIAATSCWSQVWNGTGGIFYDRVPVATPTLADYSLRLVLGQFTITAPASTTAGTAISSNVTLKDSGSATITDYPNGSHTLVFSGANAAPDGTPPTYRDGNNRDQPFGANTALAFTSGAYTGTTNVRLYTAETATISAVEDVYAPITAYYICGGGTACTGDAVVQLTTAVAPSVVVGVTAVNAANSTLTPIIANVASATVQPITVTALDTYKNPISGASTSLSSTGTPTLSGTAPTNGAGIYAGSITTTTLGTYTVSATVAGTLITPTLNITFVSTTGKEATPTAVKDSQARLSAGDTLSATNVTGGAVLLNGSSAPGGAIVGGPPGIGFIGAGAHTLVGNAGQYLVVQGNFNNTSQLYDGIGAFTSGPTFTDTSGPVALTVPVGLGGHSFKIQSGTNQGKFLLIPGGQGVNVLTANKTMLIDPNGWVVSNGPATLSGPAAGAATAGAGAGAFSIALSSIPGFSTDTRTLIVHAGGTSGIGGTTNTSIYDASNNTIVAGPALTANAGDGAFGIVRPNGTLLIVHGNNSTGTTLYTPAASPGIGGTAAGPATPIAITRGGHGISYTSAAAANACVTGSVASAPCYLIVTGTTTNTTKYDPALNTFLAGPALTASAGPGANTFLRADGTYLIVLGNTTATTNIFTPAPAGIAAGPGLGGNAGTGSHALQQIDHEYLIFLGGVQNQTALYSAGWNGSGTFATEWVDPGNVDSWTQLGYTTVLSGGTVRIDYLVAKDNLGTGQITAMTTPALNGTQTAALALGSTSDRKWVQASVTLTRPVPATATHVADEQRGVFLGAGYTAQIRTQTVSPTLTSLSFSYRSGYFRITAGAPQVAGVSFAASAFKLVDDTSSDTSTGVIADYAGTHTVVFSGANTAPNGTSVPTARNASAVDVAFGSNTTISFTSGVGGTTFTLYKAETANPAATETVNGQSCPVPQVCGITAGNPIQTVAPAIVVNPANPDAAQSLVSVSPSTVPADDVALSTISITVKDAFQNLSPGVTSPYRAVSIALVPTTLGGEAPTITNATGNVDASAAYSATMHSGKSGSVTVKVTISHGFDAMSPDNVLLNSQPTVTFAVITLVVTPVDGSGNPIAGPTVTAGQTFGLKIEAHIVSPSSTDTSFCDGAGSPAATCAIAFSTSAGNAPDGTVPTLSGTLSAVQFSAGFYTTGLAAFDLVCANGQGVSCLTQTSAHTITVSATQVAQPSGHGTVVLTGTSSGITVNTAATNSRNGIGGTAVQSFVLVSPTAVGTTTAVGVPTTVSVWTRVVDGFGNPAPASPSRTVTFSSTAGAFSGGINTAATATSAGGAVYGFAGPVSLTSASAATGTISATISDNGASAQTATAYYVANLPRINNGTYYGTLTSANGAAPVAAPIAGKGVPLAVVTTDSATKPALSVSGTALVSTADACWTIGSGNPTGGAFDATGVPAGACTGTTTSAGDVLASQVAISNAGRVTYWKAGQPGAAALHVAAGNASFDYALTVAGYFQVATASTPNNRLVTALIDWDGGTARVIGWFAPEP